MNLRILSASAAVVALSLVSCSKMNGLHKPYLEKGETVYAAKVDSVKALVGVNSQVLDIFVPANRVSRGVVRWNLGQDSLEFSLPASLVSPVRVVVPGLEEGNYTYDIVTYDSYNNKSLAYEVTSNVVSEETMAAHKDMMTKSLYYSEYDACLKKIASMYPKAKISNAQNFGGSAWFMWECDPLPGAKVVFRYINRDNVWTTREFAGENIKNKAWESSLKDALCEPKDQVVFYYHTVYENLGFVHKVSHRVDLGEEYADRWYDYEAEIRIDSYSYPEASDNW